MFVNHSQKIIYAFHYEKCVVANFIAHCVKDEPGWSVKFLNSEREMEEHKSEAK